LPTAVIIEQGKQRVFACALEWPGWCRSARTEEAALAALDTYVPRYVVVARQAGVTFPSRHTFEVAERRAGGGGTDFGVPSETAEHDAERLTLASAQRQAALVDAAWHVFDEIVAGAPASLRKGPRGGGRDRDAIVDHVLGAEVVYARKLGLRHRQPAADDRAAIEAVRSDLLRILGATNDGQPLVEKGWLPRYAARRIAWHVLDHAGEIEDRSGS
jgi:hypothetical protein